MKKSKQNWIFLRGLSRERAHWGSFPQTFEKRVEGARVATLDLPGNGDRHDEQTPIAIPALVEAVRAEWKEKGDGPAMLFAMSLGAMVGLEWMRKYPDEIQGAVLVNTSLKAVSPFYQRMSPAAYPVLFRAFLDRNPRNRERRILALTSQHRDWEEKVFKERADIQKKHPVTRMNAFRQILAAVASPDARKPQQPVLILNSLGDLLVHPDCSRDLAKLWGVPLKRHAWAGHDLPLDDPQWTITAVVEWLEMLKSQTQSDSPQQLDKAKSRG